MLLLSKMMVIHSLFMQKREVKTGSSKVAWKTDEENENGNLTLKEKGTQ